MKIKIVYIVSSDDTDLYLEQTYLSVYSLRKWNPDAFVELVVDQRTDATLKEKRIGILQLISKKTVVEVPDCYNKAQVSRWLKTSMRQHVEGDFLFIDSDTIITDDLRDIDSFAGDLGAVLNVHILAGMHPDKRYLKFWAKRDGWTYSDDLRYYNSGVLLVRETPIAHKLFDCWHRRWKEGLRNSNHVFDQTYLAAANEDCGYPIIEMDGIWNCQIAKNGLKYLYGAKIMHYLAYEQYNSSPSWSFYDNNICLSIKESGIINQGVDYMVTHAKSSFADMSTIVTGNELMMIGTRLVRFLYKCSPIILPIETFVNNCVCHIKNRSNGKKHSY